MIEEEKLFYTIGEVALKVNVKPYVLRYWETEFRKLNPQKSVTGQRAYRQRDVRMAKTIKRLLYEEKYTIAGAIKILEELDEKEGLDPLDESGVKEAPPVARPEPPRMEERVFVPEKVEPPPARRAPPAEKISELGKLIAATKAILKKYNLA
jgi:DNA-binding transcriptional MerR regulator